MIDNLTGFEMGLPVKADAPEDTAETIENVLEDCNDGIKMIIIDESEAKGFWVVLQDTKCQGYTEKPSPDLLKVDFNDDLKFYWKIISW